MSQTAIFGPVFATVLLTFLVWVVMFVRRVRFINSPADLAVPSTLAELSPPEVSWSSARCTARCTAPSTS